MAVGLLLCGCGKEDEVMMVRMYLQAPQQGYSESLTRELTLPVSQMTYKVRREPVIMERMITNVDLVRVQPSNDFALQFQLDQEGRRRLLETSVGQRGQVLITTVNEVPIGARRLTGPISDGLYFTFAQELTQAELGKVAQELKENAVFVQEVRENRSMLR